MCILEHYKLQRTAKQTRTHTKAPDIYLGNSKRLDRQSDLQRISTMLLDDTPANLVKATIENFSTAQDRNAVSRINDSLSTLQQSRSIRIDNGETALRKLSRQLATVRSQHREATDSHSSQQHAVEVEDLDNKKFRVAKQMQDLEDENSKLETQLNRLQRQLQDLEHQGVEGDAETRRIREGDDPTVYVLSLRRRSRC